MSEQNSNATVEAEPVQPSTPGNGNGHAHKAAPADEYDMPKDLKKPSNWLVIVVAVIFVLLLAGIFVVGYIPAQSEKNSSEKVARDTVNTLPTVVVRHPAPPTVVQSIKLPASLVPERETDIYSQANGKLVKNECEINDLVKANDELAVIATPDVEATLAVNVANLHQAQANVVKAQADVDIAKLTLDRYETWYKSGTGGESEQDLDDKRAAYRDALATLDQMKASVDSAQAAIKQTQTQLDFDKVHAPYDGMIIDRKYDPGAFLQPNNNTTQAPMFTIAEIDKLRAFVTVPQTYVSMIRPERSPTAPLDKDDGPEVLAYLTVTNFPGEKFTGHLRRAKGTLDPNTRTMQYLVRFDNDDRRLRPGMYGQVEIPLVNNSPILVIPSSAMIFDETGTKVAVVDSSNKLHFKKITVGRDLGTELEVRDGLSLDDSIVTNPGERLADGSEVKVTQAPPAAASPPTTPATKPSARTTRPAVADVGMDKPSK